MFDEIDARFHVKGKPILFAWGSVIYNPAGVEIPGHLMAHEEFHGWRQSGPFAHDDDGHKGSIEAWWRLYINDPEFRLEEEILAHQVEYRALLRQGGNRHARRSHLRVTAQRLAAPLYGRMISPAKARKVLIEADAA